jgi:hypothetical protein
LRYGDVVLASAAAWVCAAALAAAAPAQPASPSNPAAPSFLDRAQAAQAAAAGQASVANVLTPGIAPASGAGVQGKADVDSLLARAEVLLAHGAPVVPAAAPPAPAVAANPADAKPAEAPAAPTEATPADAKPADAKPGDAKPGDAKPGDAKPGDAKPDPKGAAALFQKALAADPQRAAPLWGLSRAWDALGDHNKARHYAELVVRSKAPDKTQEMHAAAAWRLELPQ